MNEQPIPKECHACGTPLPEGTDRCSRCKALHAKFRQCDACGALAEVVPHAGIYVCNACGRPRVPVEIAVSRSYREKKVIKLVGEARSKVLKNSVVGITGTVVGAGAFLLSALVFFIGWTGLGLAISLFTLLGTVLALFGFIQASKARKVSQSHMFEAMALVALDIMKQRGDVTPAQLSEWMNIDEPVAEKVLAYLSARTDVRVSAEVDDRAALDGQVRYRLADMSQLIQSTNKQTEMLEAASEEERFAQLEEELQQKNKARLPNP